METITLHINGSTKEVELKEVVCAVCKKNTFRVTVDSKRDTCSTYCLLESKPGVKGKRMRQDHFNKWVNWNIKNDISMV